MGPETKFLERRKNILKIKVKRMRKRCIKNKDQAKQRILGLYNHPKKIKGGILSLYGRRKLRNIHLISFF